MKRVFFVIGCGSIGRRHLRNLRELDAGRVLAWDPSPERLAETERETGAIAVPSLEAGLADGANVCLVCSPTSCHAEQAIALARHADLFIEKPVAITHAEALRVAEAVESHGRICLVGCNMRFHAGLVAVKRALEADAIGRPLSIRAEFGSYLPDWHPWEDYRKGYSARSELGGGIVLDDIHEIDIVRWLCGEYRNVVALRGHVSDLEFEAEDIATLIGRTVDGVWCEIHMDYLQRIYSRWCKVIGTEGTLLWDYSSARTVLMRPNAADEVLCDFEGTNTNEMYLEQLRHFLRCLDGEESPSQDARAAAEAVRIAEAFQFVRP